MNRALLAAWAAVLPLGVARPLMAGSGWSHFHPLPGLGLSGEQTSIYRLSDDGSTALGYVTTGEGVRYSVAWINGQAQVIPSIAQNTTINDLSGDGSTLVGSIYLGSTFYGCVWQYLDGGYQQHLVADLPGGGTFSKLYKVSRDGTRAIGVARSVPARAQAAYWNIDDGAGAPAHGLGYLQPWNIQWSEGYAISADGSVMAGNGRNNAGDLAFSTRFGEMAAEPGVHGVFGASAIFDMSFDARFMVGYSRTATYGSPTEPTIWVDGEPDLLPLIPGLNYTHGSQASFVSDDGSLVSGSVWIGDSVHRILWINREPVLWNDYLQTLTLAPEGWQLSSASFSEDGRYLYGIAIDPQGLQQGFIATIPSPATVTCTVPVLILIYTRRRKRSSPPMSNDVLSPRLDQPPRIARGHG